MQPLILTNAFLRPRASRFSSGVSVSEDTNVYACVEEVIGVIRDKLEASPLIQPTDFDRASVSCFLENVDGVFLPGAISNIHPSAYAGAVDLAKAQTFDQAHDATDLFLIREAYRLGIPFFGICRAYQAMNVAFGGSLHFLPPSTINHECSLPCDGHDADARFMHDVALEDGGVLSTLFTERTLKVNSLHEQAVDRVGENLRIEARAPDGTIEALSAPQAKSFFLGVQWHPEALPDHAVSQSLFTAFREAVRKRFETRA